MLERRTRDLLPNVQKLSSLLRRDILPIIERIPAYGRLLYALLTSNEIPTRTKSALLLALGYQISPIDLIPGFIPVIGQLDDLLVLLWGIRRTLDMLPPDRAVAYLAEAKITQAQLEADTMLVRQALRNTLGRGLGIARRGVITALGAGILGTAFLGYLAYYTVRGRRT